MSLDKELRACEGDFDGASDDMLALAAKSSDHPHSALARNALYLRHFDRISAMAARAKRIVAMMSDTDRSMEMEDVDQQTFLIFCHLLDNWNGNSEEESFLSYLARHMPSHASHYVRDTLHYRVKRRVGGVGLRLIASSNSSSQFRTSPQPVESAVDDQAEFEDVLDAQIESAIFWAYHTSSLTPQSNRCITLRYSHGLTSAQIADLCGVSRRTVDRELKAAITQIRHELLSTWENCA